MRLVALYKRPQDTAAFDKYYFENHKPLAERIPEIAESRCSKVIGGPQGKSPWYFMGEICFKDKESLKAGMSSPEALAAGKDVENFAKGLCEVFFVDEIPTPVGR